MENRDYLKDFVDENRSQFEDDFESKNLWSGIASQLKPQQKPITRIISIKWLSLAASVLLLIGVGFMWGRSGITSGGEFAENNEPIYVMDHQYAKQVNLLVAEARKNNDVEESVFEDIKLLDIQYQELESEYNQVKSKGQKEIILSAMINNYRTRIDILNHVLLKIKTLNHGNNILLEETKI